MALSSRARPRQKSRQLSAHITAQQIHLPETIACGDIALRKIQIVVVRGFDIGDAAFVARMVTGSCSPAMVMVVGVC